MRDISRLPHHLDKTKHQCRAIIETPKGRRSKFKYEQDSGLFSLSNILPQGFSFPFDFGFVPCTQAEDGDPLDLIVLMDEPTHVGCLVDVRLLGVIKVVQIEDGEKTRNDRLLGVAVKTVEYKDVNAISDLPKSHVDQISEFLALYNKNSGKRDEVQGIEGPDAAVKLVEQAAARFKRK
jgi:inorganic pyrophosphatase